MHRSKMVRKVFIGGCFLFITCVSSLPAQEGVGPASVDQPGGTMRQQEAFFSVAILPFEEGENLKGMGAQAANLMQAYLAETPAFVFVERAEIDKAFGEMELGLSGTVSPATAAGVGHLVGAKVIVTGNVFVLGSQITFVAKVIGVETGRVYAQAVTQSVRESHEEGIKKLAAKVSETINHNGERLLAKTTEEDDIFEQYALALKERELPSVSVDIPETHMNRAVMDPAAETETGLILRTLGFPLQDSSVAGQTAAVEITGAAFSEYAGRRGNLISCKARVEIKAVRVKTGEILAVDRETAAAVDVAENIAGKLAIEKATRKILERIVPKLVP